MEENNQPINTSFFDAAFKSKLSDNKEFKQITNERAKEIMTECLNWHEEIYLPAEKVTEQKLGRPLNFGEQMALYLHLKFVVDGME